MTTKTTYSIYQIDAFVCDQAGSYSGNPAAVVPLESWLPDEIMLDIAAANNLSETAFFVKQSDDSYYIRWFTPTTEIELCGHATLASAHVMHQVLGDNREELPIRCGLGDIPTRVINTGTYELRFPIRAPQSLDDPELMQQVSEAINHPVQALYQSRDLIALLNHSSDVINCTPNAQQIKQLDAYALVVTAPSDDPTLDFVSRFFAPKQGINEDPVTGSSFCSLAPLWSDLLGKQTLAAKQCSQRGGEVGLTIEKDTVLIRGNSFEYLRGEIQLP